MNPADSRDELRAALERLTALARGYEPEYDSGMDSQRLEILRQEILDLPATPAKAIEGEERVDYEEMRLERGWPTPNHMRRTADALDMLTPARYGDVLRWFADLADGSLTARPANETTREPPDDELVDPRFEMDDWTAPSTPAGDELREALLDIEGWSKGLGPRMDDNDEDAGRGNLGRIHRRARQALDAASQPRNEDGLREDVLRWVFALYQGVWDPEPGDEPRSEVRIIGTAGEVAALIARKYVEYDREYPPAAQSGEAAGEGEGRG